MLQFIGLTLLWVTCHADFYLPYNVTHSTVSGIAAYRSALTLDWLAAEDSRQTELAHVFEDDAPMSKEIDQSECMTSSRPAAGKVAKLMLEVLKNLENDDGVIQEFTHTLLKVKLLVETSQLDSEPDLETLVQTPRLMQGEPHATLPRLLGVVWMLASDPITTKASGWCPIKKLTQYLASTPPAEIAKRMRTIDPIVARARFIIEEFMQKVAPINLKGQLGFRPEIRRHFNHHQMTRKPPTRSAMDRGSAVREGTKTSMPSIPTAQKPASLRNAAYSLASSYVCLVICLFVI